MFWVSVSSLFTLKLLDELLVRLGKQLEDSPGATLNISCRSSPDPAKRAGPDILFYGDSLRPLFR